MIDVLLKVRDRAKKEWILGPTHEEVVTTLVAGEISSYRQLPKNFYQIQTKFRDEIRPRFGLMRAKEFIMKDAYSFDISDEAAQVSYQKMYQTYTRIFQRCGLQTVAVDADTGAIGGKHSHEFMVPAETGENEIVYCESGEYAANIEKATSRIQEATSTLDTGTSVEKFPTPGAVTINSLVRQPYGVAMRDQIKTLVYLIDGKVTLVLMRGDHQLNDTKLAAATGGTQIRPSTPDEIFVALGAHPGSLGAVGVLGVTILADESLKNAAGMTTGANEDGFHFRHVNIARDIPVTSWHDLRLVAAGEPCPVTGTPLKIRRAIEVGHVFKLGTKYSESLGALFVDEAGEKRALIMGCYGIGVTRTLQAVIEQSNDKDGIIWPINVAPFTVCITPLSIASESPVMLVAERLYQELTERNVDVILDDRDERPGVKFKDSELIGYPIRIGIGEKSLAKGEVEIKPRKGSLQAVPAHDALEYILAYLKNNS